MVSRTAIESFYDVGGWDTFQKYGDRGVPTVNQDKIGHLFRFIFVVLSPGSGGLLITVSTALTFIEVVIGFGGLSVGSPLVDCRGGTIQRGP